ncbi:unnamed protein product [Linum tenue]|uniref:Uncharacterized protein n=1 Tax=Linum tenue TaxID=586396 RepID=A0AAV0J404_9ROSI|nr:unnamed protein product [Linum tenue]
MLKNQDFTNEERKVREPQSKINLFTMGSRETVVAAAVIVLLAGGDNLNQICKMVKG